MHLISISGGESSQIKKPTNVVFLFTVHQHPFCSIINSIQKVADVFNFTLKGQLMVRNNTFFLAIGSFLRRLFVDAASGHQQ